MPVKTDISRDHPQPSGKGGSAFRLEFQEPAKTVPCKSLADVEIAISRGVCIGGTGTGSLVQHRAVRIQKFCPGVARIRRPERFEKKRNPAMAHRLLRGEAQHKFDPWSLA